MPHRDYFRDDDRETIGEDFAGRERRERATFDPHDREFKVAKRERRERARDGDGSTTSKTSGTPQVGDRITIRGITITVNQVNPKTGSVAGVRSDRRPGEIGYVAQFSTVDQIRSGYTPHGGVRGGWDDAARFGGDDRTPGVLASPLSQGSDPLTPQDIIDGFKSGDFNEATAITALTQLFGGNAHSARAYFNAARTGNTVSLTQSNGVWRLQSDRPPPPVGNNNFALDTQPPFNFGDDGSFNFFNRPSFLEGLEESQEVDVRYLAVPWVTSCRRTWPARYGAFSRVSSRDLITISF